MARPVATVPSGGLAVTEVTQFGVPVTESSAGLPVTKVPSGGLAVTYVPTMIAMPSAPTSASAAGSPTVITINMSNPLNTAILPAPADFSVLWGGVAKTVASVALASRKILLTMTTGLGSPAPASSTASYTPGATPMKGVDGRQVAAFSGVVIT